MTSDLLHGTGVGVVTSGGSESLITSLYSYREYARATRGVTSPNVVMPVTAHVALDKGAHWMDIEMRHAPLTGALRRRRRRHGGAHRRPDDRPGRQRGQLRARPHRPDRGDRRAGAVARHRHARRRLPRRLAAARGSSVSATTCRSGTSACPASRRSRPTRTSTATRSRARACCCTATRNCASTSTSPSRTGPAASTCRRASPARAAAGSSPPRGPRSWRPASPATSPRPTTSCARRSPSATASATASPSSRSSATRLFLIAFKPAGDLDIYLVNDALIAQGWRMIALQFPPALHFCVTRPNTAPGLADSFLEALRGAVVYATEHKGQRGQVRRRVRLRRHAAGQR